MRSMFGGRAMAARGHPPSSFGFDSRRGPVHVGAYHERVRFAYITRRSRASGFRPSGENFNAKAQRRKTTNLVHFRVFALLASLR
ncbi:hypothetical protein WMF04_29630 [Sorangium sp. So ce260]|uniref:hypothetical protein n=1 Tax=Sorangium sp. So ce260 TaxID=3133291 RepID=UPI003F6351CD